VTALTVLAATRPWGAAFALLAVAGLVLVVGLVALVASRRR
jgi:hypothetical protein